VGAPALLRHWAAVGGATKGELKAAIEALAERTWRHPTTGEPVRFGFSTIERWYYRAFKERSDPVGRLRRKLRSDAGQQPAMSDAVRQAVLAQYAAHKGWSAKLHHDAAVQKVPLPSAALDRLSGLQHTSAGELQ
jgi:hypothetical protein